jgi:hypothetical protein
MPANDSCAPSRSPAGSRATTSSNRDRVEPKRRPGRSLTARLPCHAMATLATIASRSIAFRYAAAIFLPETSSAPGSNKVTLSPDRARTSRGRPGSITQKANSPTFGFRPRSSTKSALSPQPPPCPRAPRVGATLAAETQSSAKTMHVPSGSTHVDPCRTSTIRPQHASTLVQDIEFPTFPLSREHDACRRR